MVKMVALGEVADFQNGRAFKPAEWEEEGLPIIRIQNLNDPSKPFNYTKKPIDPKFHVRHRDILFSWSGTPGTSFGCFRWEGEEGWLNQHIFNVRFKDDVEVDGDFFIRSVNSQMLRIIDQAHGGVGLQHITKKKLLLVKIPLPPLEEQKRIAGILDAADALRAKRRESIALLDDLLQSTFLDMFGDPVTNPMGWERKKLGEIIKFTGGSQPPKHTFIYEPKDGYVRLVQIRDFKTDKYPTFIPEGLAKRPFEEDDVMIARYGPPVFQILTGLSGSYNVALMKADPIGDVEKPFIFYLLDLPAVNSAVVAQSERTAGQSGVNLKFLNNYPAFLPPLDLQKRFAAIVESVEQQKARLRTQLTELDNLFISLQQRAFRGEL